MQSENGKNSSSGSSNSSSSGRIELNGNGNGVAHTHKHSLKRGYEDIGVRIDIEDNGGRGRDGSRGSDEGSVGTELDHTHTSSLGKMKVKVKEKGPTACSTSTPMTHISNNNYNDKNGNGDKVFNQIKNHTVQNAIPVGSTSRGAFESKVEKQVVQMDLGSEIPLMKSIKLNRLLPRARGKVQAPLKLFR